MAGLSDDARQDLLRAIGRARLWLQELLDGAEIETIAAREGWTVRHVRLLIRLAFVSPAAVRAIVDGEMPKVTITDLANTLPHKWAA